MNSTGSQLTCNWDPEQQGRCILIWCALACGCNKLGTARSTQGAANTPALHRAFTRRKTGLKQWYFGSSWKTESLLLQQHGGGEPLPSNSALWAGTGVVMGTCVPIPRGGWEHPMPWQSCWSRWAPAHQAPTARSKAVLLLLLWTYCVFCKLKKKKKNRLSNEPAQESLRIAFKSITTSPTAEFPLNLNPVE